LLGGLTLEAKYKANTNTAENCHCAFNSTQPLRYSVVYQAILAILATCAVHPFWALRFLNLKHGNKEQRQMKKKRRKQEQKRKTREMEEGGG